MKRILLVIVLLSVFLLSGCDVFVITTTNDSQGTEDNINIESTTDIPTTNDNTTQNSTNEQTTEEVYTEYPTTNELTTEIPTTNDTTTEPITTIVNEDIYMQLNAGQDTVEINSEWIDAGALFVSNDSSFEMETEDEIDMTTLGVKTITYTYSYQETQYQIIRYVMVVDQIAPEVDLNLGVDTIKVGENWMDSGVTVTDNSGQVITVVVTGEVDSSTAGTYLINYNATDLSGNETTIRRYVTVIENE